MTNDDRINDPDAQIDSQIMKLVEQYASCDRRSADINDERATIRGNAEKLGFTSQEFQDGVRRVKKMSKTERDIHERNVLRIVNIAETRQAELWPKETARQNKRAEERAAEPRDKAALDAKTDTDPKSDPAAGGAQIDIEDAIKAANTAEAVAGEPDIGPGTYHSSPKGQGETIEQREAAEGEAALAAAAPSIAKPKPKSQSAKAAEKSRAAGLN